jgi:diadenosine tetraphosphate (Ap4A) HIT family hydrolase
MPDFIDVRISSSCIAIGDWPLSRVFLKNNRLYPWLILLPKREGVQELDELAPADRYQLMDEIAALSRILKAEFTPDKINIGALGNIVSQLHVHVVGRFKHDPLWPQGIWQAALTDMPYDQSTLDELLPRIQSTIDIYRTE